MLGRLVQPEIHEMIEQRNFSLLKETFADWAPADMAELLVDLSEQDQLVLFRLLPRAKAADVFEYMPLAEQETLIKAMGTEAAAVLNEMAPDDRTALLEELPSQVCARLIQMLSPEERRVAQTLLNYPEQSVGRLMTSEYLTIRDEWTAREVLDHIRARGRDSETLNVLYVVDAKGRLLDDLRLREFLLCSLDKRVREIRDENFVALRATDDQETAVELFRRHDRTALPVVDSQEVLVGIVTVDDVLDVAEEEATEDFHLASAIEPLDDHYSESSVWNLFAKRVGWLVVLVFVSLASSGVIAAFEKTLASAITLAFFIPLLIASGGNTGAQSATLMVRALATGDVELSQWLSAFFKEILVGVALGVSMGVVSSLLGVFRGGFQIGLVVGSTMLTIVLVANLIGVAMPFLLTRFKIDPAVASSPLITTVTDAVGLLIYFTIASLILKLN